MNTFKKLILVLGAIIFSLTYTHLMAWPVINGVAISTAYIPQGDPQIATDGHGGSIITWQDSRNGFNDLYVQDMDSTGAVKWTQGGVAICTVSSNKVNQRIVSDGLGGVFIVWQDERSNHFYPQLYAQAISSTGTLKWALSGVTICTTSWNQAYGQINPELVSDGQGGAIITWEDYRNGNYYDIYAQDINSAGTVKWTLNGAAVCTAGGGDSNPELVSDGQGGAIMTWQDSRTDANDIYAQDINSTGTAKWALNGVAICTAGGGDSNPELVSDGQGGAIMTWQDSRTDWGDIYAQAVDSTGAVKWTQNGIAICTSEGPDYNPELVSDGQGGAIITWEDNRNGNFYDIYAQAADSTGAVKWTQNGVTICTATSILVTASFNPELVSDGQGGAIITWQDYRNGHYYEIYAQAVDSTGTAKWTLNGIAICTGEGPDSNPKLVTDGQGGAIITWQDNRNGFDAFIYAQATDTAGTVNWTQNGVVICPPVSNQNNPELVSDGQGGAIITWQDNRGNINNYYNIYAQAIDSTGAVEWDIPYGVNICTASSNRYNPQIVSDGQGGAIMTWQDGRSWTDWDVYAQAIDSTGAVKWTSNGVGVYVGNTTSVLYTNQQLVSDGQGGAIIAWQDDRNHGVPYIYAQAINNSGTVQWTHNGVAICTTVNNFNSKLVSDGQGGAIITWQDKRRGSSFYDVYAQAIDSTGAVKWTQNGVVISTTTAIFSLPTNPQLVSDGQGGAIITWQDYRNGHYYEVYAQAIDSTGTVKWTQNGVAISIASTASSPQLVSDGQGGALITWQDYRNDTGDIYAQAIDSTGTIKWTQNGVAISIASTASSPQLVSDGQGGAIITWQDDRNDSHGDIYAQYVDSSGFSLWTTNGVAICTASNYQSSPELVSDGQGGAIITWQDYRNGTNYDIYAQGINMNGIEPVEMSQFYIEP